MIAIDHVCKTYPTRSGPRTILDNISLTVSKGEHLGILGRNGAGKSTLIRMISGQEFPTSGKIVRKMSVSWPLAFSGAFQGSLTGWDNLRFIARIYGKDAHQMRGFVEDFAELGRYFREPVKTYSSGMQARLAFALSLGIDFDCFLIDEIIAVGDARFHEKCRYELFEKRRDHAFIIVSHDPGTIAVNCTKAAVLNEGCLTEFETVELAYQFYNAANLTS